MKTATSAYLGTALLAFGTLALEICLTRLLSVVSWYFLAFFAISVAMLGMTAGAISVFRSKTPESITEQIRQISRASLHFAWAAPFCVLVVCTVPIHFRSTLQGFASFFLVTAACTLPFFFSGVAITQVLTRGPWPVGTAYASDLVGASAGCLFVLLGLEFLDLPSLTILCGAVGAASAIAFRAGAQELPRSRVGPAALLCLLAAAAVNSSPYRPLRPVMVRGEREERGSFILTEWNSYSRVTVAPLVQGPPQLWGPSPEFSYADISQYQIRIDGDAGTALRRFQSWDDLDHLRYDVTNLAYYLRPKGGACIIGFGGGRDVQSALLFGHERVLGIDINSVMMDLLEKRFREFAGVADREEVTLVVDDARSLLARSQEKFALIQMSLIDTWAATGAGAYSLSENGLYTVEAWQVFLDRLTEDGIFTVTRWHSPTNLGEAGRMVSLAQAVLLDRGVVDPRGHIALVSDSSLSTLLISNQPLRPADIEALEGVSATLGFDPTIIPGEPVENRILEMILNTDSVERLSEVGEGTGFNFRAPTDDNPYFFNMLRLRDLFRQASVGGRLEEGVLTGNRLATLTLFLLVGSLMAVAACIVVLPLWVRHGEVDERFPRGFWPGAAYFSLIGVGFMFTEIALIQRLSVFLGHPVYALSILLFGLIASTGLGSFLSEHMPVSRGPWVYLFPLATAAAVASLPPALALMGSTAHQLPILGRVLLSLVLIVPVGLLLGVFFPVGMRLVRQRMGRDRAPWFWALNGVFGVLASALAVLFAISYGISVNLYSAAGCYAAVAGCVVLLLRREGTGEILA